MEGRKENLRAHPCTHERDGVDPAGRLLNAVEPSPLAAQEARARLEVEGCRRKGIPDRLGI